MTLQTSIIDPMLALYHAPAGARNNPELALAEYRKHLGGYPDRVMEKAWDILVVEYQGRSWPTIAEIRKYLNRSAEFYRNRDNINNSQNATNITTDMVFSTEQGIAALEAGMGLSFSNYCALKNEVPDYDTTKNLLARWATSIDRMKNDPDPRIRLMYENQKKANFDAECSLKELSLIHI